MFPIANPTLTYPTSPYPTSPYPTEPFAPIHLFLYLCHYRSAIINTVRFKKLVGMVTDRRYKTFHPTTAIATGTTTTHSHTSSSSSGSGSGMVSVAHPEEMKTLLSFREFVRVMIFISDAAFPKVG